MFWSAVLDLKTQRPPTRSYGSFNRPTSTSTSTFHIPQSIPEHQPISQFTSPLPDRFRLEEYIERPDTVSARTQASLQLSEQTQTALKLLLQRERESKNTIQPQDVRAMNRMKKTRNDLPERMPLLQSIDIDSVYNQEEPNPQESSNEHNYWMQELERRRAGLRKSRRRTCTSMSERATTSPFKVGLVMCSVPLVLMFGFVLFVFLSGTRYETAKESVKEFVGMGTVGKQDEKSINTITRDNQVVMNWKVSKRLRSVVRE
ncbi:uncharacterized protein PHALS_11855 [Plasmopara halstedii]|uniref:Uncharacterized protein n=1 Tax=Plasmopara halstedii TaxID=4781 RepID=A0A0P1AKF2_PLAHL|nr:uncharacterized protein PHALS_11855 [Plasmopara halstedii]CEG41514.1 hypothetical protein PHALS_11855 [Plasmopara halstedii]|eukprot:XP_024577883.1 hypothetical protein PHALS_11855 [Plasmopara halstedii]